MPNIAHTQSIVFALFFIALVIAFCFAACRAPSADELIAQELDGTRPDQRRPVRADQR